MKTVLILMAQFGPRATLSIEEVRKAYFSHITVTDFTKKLSNGDIPLPTMHVEKGRHSAKFVSMLDLAIYLDTQMEAGRQEYARIKAEAGTGLDSNKRFAEIMFNRGNDSTAN